MQIRITLLIVSFIYTMLTSIVYFSKNRINNSENAVYEKLLSITPIGLLLEIGCNVTAIYKMNDLVSSIISRLYLIFILVWLTTFTLYILTITKYKGDKLTEYKNSKIRKSIIIGSIFSILLLIFLPIDFVLEKNSAYLGGMGIVFLLAITFLLIILDFILFIKYFKNMTFREKVPMLLLLLLIGGLLLVNNIAPEIQIISSSFALITVIMYFTIENPDKKLLEEIHMSKKIADAANEDKSMLIYNMMNEVKSIASDINKSSEVILNSNNLEENRFFAREIISSNNKLYSMANNIYNIDVIDDNNSSIKLISKILDKHNILYDSSNLGKEALDRIRKGDKYDLILLDEDMPYMNGISVMNKFSKIKGFGTKVILLTKNSNIIYDDIYKDSGFSDYIIKPIDKDDLMNKINKYLK